MDRDRGQLEVVTVDCGPWTVDSFEVVTVDCGPWTVDCFDSSVDRGLWTVDRGLF